ncbi:VOC family protein [Dyadobacter psychrotolerans]|uniref:VOC family protein n=1 Tax=Dyadobacter psychrotolerans TaxID=2541721 RepID=A0A4R5DWF6_9BACT|nr:VOC family protein [Dyadobacter psychrotolerans]TDE15363.1 VOC family protein [Dyadobacter psychrotolerans]
MLKDVKAFSGYSVDSLQTAKQFYSEVLKLEVSENKEMPLLNLHINGSSDVMIYEKPDHKPATYTVLNFPVEDIESVVSELKGAGVNFESYDLPQLKTDQDNIMRGNGPSIAWFKDPAGNILSVIGA